MAMSGLLNRMVRYFNANSVGSTGDEHPDFDKGIRLSGVPLDCARVALTAGASTSGGATFAWQNPHAESIIVHNVILDITTQSTGAATIDIGYTATSATTSSDTIIDGKSLATAGIFENKLAATLGTNGKPTVKAASGKWITGTPSADTTGLVGYVYIYYTRVL